MNLLVWEACRRAAPQTGRFIEDTESGSQVWKKVGLPLFILANLWEVFYLLSYKAFC